MGPVVMSFSFDVPFDVFAFDDAGVGSASAGWEESPGEFSDGVAPETFDDAR